MKQREMALMQVADVVFTGGPALFDARRGLHPNVHCFPSAVDADHYAPATVRRGSPEIDRAQALQAPIAAPRLGFFGVIDERLDAELLGALAKADPSWQIVVVGPVVKVDPATLPRAPNLHWLGQQSYDALPGFVAGWDVCLLPFALNDSTRFISPTKTLEYMAAEKPVVSTPVRDVVRLYGDVVRIADGAEAFIAACRAVLAEDAGARAARVAAMRERVAQYSWQHTAEAMAKLIDAAVAANDRSAAPADAVALPKMAARGAA